MKNLKIMLKNSFIMSIFAILALLIVSYINNVTKNKIKIQKEKENRIFIEQVIPPSIYHRFQKKNI